VRCSDEVAQYRRSQYCRRTGQVAYGGGSNVTHQEAIEEHCEEPSDGDRNSFGGPRTRSFVLLLWSDALDRLAECSAQGACCAPRQGGRIAL